MALKGRRSTPEERLQAVQLLKEGNEAAVVARMFSVSRAMLFRWQQKYDQGGPVALETKKTPGPASRLSLTQLSKLYAIITGSDPRQLEFDFGLWTRKIIRELIRREFGVKLSEVQVGRLLNKIGLSPQRPLYRAYQQDPERVEEWKNPLTRRSAGWRPRRAQSSSQMRPAYGPTITPGPRGRPSARPRSSSRLASGSR